MTTVKARGVFAIEFTWNTANGSISRPVVPMRDAALASVNRMSGCFSHPLSFPTSFSLFLSLSLSISLTRPVSCASPLNHGDSYFCTSSSSSATMPDRRCLSRNPLGSYSHADPREIHRMRRSSRITDEQTRYQIVIGNVSGKSVKVFA
jgi:hypothetical protein